MKRVLIFILATVLLIFAVTGCDLLSSSNPSGKDDHVHAGGIATCEKEAVCTECGESYGDKAPHNYNYANCVLPKTCKVCGITDGEAKGHSYNDATCAAPKTCEVCGAIYGKANGHKYKDATCTDPKICEICGDTDGRANGHKYKDATCTEPKICEVCGDTDGESNGHSYNNATCTEPKTCSVCGDKVGAAEHKYNDSYSYDENGHWFACSECGDKEDEGVHTGGEATLTEQAICDVCGARYGDMKEITIDWRTEAVFPADGTGLILANPRVYEWYNSYNFNTTDTDAHWLEKDIFAPIVPVIRWSVGEDAHYYKVYVSKNEDLTGAQCYLTVTCELSLEHLFVDTDYYWRVDAIYDGYTVRSDTFSFKTSKSPRTVDIEGVSNARDLGGYITLDGMRIKQGMIYRSAKLDDITELGKYTLVNILGVKTDLDLRGARTIDGTGNVYMDPRNATYPVSELNHITVASPWYSTGENGIWYAADDFNKEEFAKSIKVFADPGNYPIIFHCSLGRDRTGTLAMVLGGLLGLDENTLIMEYELSVFSYWGAYGSTKYNNGLRNQIHDTYLYIDNNYDGDTYSEKVESFLLEIGVTAEEIASIKSIMLEEVE